MKKLAFIASAILLGTVVFAAVNDISPRSHDVNETIDISHINSWLKYYCREGRCDV